MMQSVLLIKTNDLHNAEVCAGAAFRRVSHMSDSEKKTTGRKYHYEMAYFTRGRCRPGTKKQARPKTSCACVTEQYRRITEVCFGLYFSVHMVEGNPVETVHGRGCLSITGYSPDEFSSDNFLWINMVFEEDRPLVLRHGCWCPFRD